MYPVVYMHNQKPIFEMFTLKYIFLKVTQMIIQVSLTGMYKDMGNWCLPSLVGHQQGMTGGGVEFPSSQPATRGEGGPQWPVTERTGGTASVEMLALLPVAEPVSGGH